MGLSGDPRELERRGAFDIVIIGSGYGAGVLAARLPATRRSICVLERGREYALDDFPTRGSAVRKETQITTESHRVGSPLGLFDLRVDNDLSVLVGCGLGGTSLINAGVSLKPSARVFDAAAWPRALRGETLAPYYARAQEVLRPAPTPSLYGKARQLQELASRCGHPFAQTDVNVAFAPHGEQPGCNQCGNCVTGCPTGAKNTICQTYLPIAKRAGVAIYTRCAARWIEPHGDRYVVHYARYAPDGSATDHRVEARAVVLGAGTFGSTEILLRSREHGLRVSRRLGERFSGNGDMMALGYAFPTRIDSVGFGPAARGRPPVGPTISGIIDLRNDDPATPLTDSMIIEEGAFPGALATLLRYLVEILAATDHGPSRIPWPVQVKMWARELLDLIGIDAAAGALNHTQMFFAIGHDDSGGRLVLDGDRIHVRWPAIGDLPAYRRAMELFQRLIAADRGLLIDYPLYRHWGHSRMLSAHPLGGCALGDDADHGVVDPYGRVYDGEGGVHERLYVADGAIVPSSLGVNPLWTISALAEWIAEHAVARISAN